MIGVVVIYRCSARRAARAQESAVGIQDTLERNSAVMVDDDVNGAFPGQCDSERCRRLSKKRHRKHRHCGRVNCDSDGEQWRNDENGVSLKHFNDCSHSGKTPRAVDAADDEPVRS